MNKLEKFINKYVLDKFTKRDELKKGITNSGWLFLDKSIRIFFGFAVNIQITRYLGPELYGSWNYILAFVALFVPLSAIGLEGIVVRELIKNKFPIFKILGSALTLRIFGSIIAFILCASIFSFQNSQDPLLMLYFLINMAVFIFSPLEIIDYYFTSQSKSKYSVFAKTSVYIILNGFKIVCLLLGLPLIWFVSLHVIDICLGLILLLLVYQSRYRAIWEWKPDLTLMKLFLKESWILMFSGIVTLIYMKIDQVMIHQILDDKELGLYSAALRISEMWYFVPVIITNSLLPALVKAFQEDLSLFQRKLQRLFDTLVWISLSLGVIFALSSKLIINFLFGAMFDKAAIILSIHIWSSIFVFMGVAINSTLIIQNRAKFSLYNTSMGAVINVILNIILIPTLGGVGAAIATLIAYSFAAIFANLIYKENRYLIWMFIGSFNLKRIFLEIYR